MDPLLNLQDSKLLHFQYVFNLLQTYHNQIKFFDIRNTDLFLSSHLNNALHIPIETFANPAVNLEEICREKVLARLRRYCIIIAYSDDVEVQANDFKKLLLDLKCREIHMLPAIDQFLLRYAFLCSDFEGAHVQDFPNEIIPNFLYLGSQEHAHNYNLMEVLAVTHVLNVTRTAANMFPGLHYCRVHVDDNETENISRYFHKAFNFIQTALEENIQGKKNVILVHCAKGVSRSATIVIMYLMRSVGLSLNETMKFLKRHRDIIEPNEGFIKALNEFEVNQHQFSRSYTARNFNRTLDEEIKLDAS